MPWSLLKVTSWTEDVLLQETEVVDGEVPAPLLRWAASAEASERALSGPQTFHARGPCAAQPTREAATGR